MVEQQVIYCPRDPQTETNLRCGRCDELICPNCLIQTDVGSRCPDCARVRTLPMYAADTGELGKAAAAGLGTAIGLAVLTVAVMVVFPLPFGGGAVGVGGIGWLVGEVVFRASNHKQSRSLQWVGALATFVGFLIVSLADPFGAIIGLIIGTYYAIQRVKPPRGIQ
jgi:hypothetical protein